ncbi:MAG: uroporphyrinogen decarboxylase family protein [Planctomycetota bacterium]|jgi:uroporphyrinogen-III decarboxylase
MTSLERVLAAIGGEPFDRYPFLNPYPYFSMMPHWPRLVGLSWLHAHYGSDAERLTFGRALNEIIGLDWVSAPHGPVGQDRRYRIRIDDAGRLGARRESGDYRRRGVPVLIDLESGDETRYEELPRDLPRTTPQYTSAAEVEAEPAPPTADEMLASGGFDFTRAAVAELGEAVFLVGTVGGAFSQAFRALTFEGLYEAIIDDPGMVHALAERAVEWNVSHIRASARVGVHGMRINEYPCGGELLSDEHFREFVLPYLERTVEAVREAGMVVILEFLGWVEPRLRHIAALELDCLQTESSLKNYRNDVGHMREVLGETVCLFSNSRILQVIEQGTEEVWRADAIEQARGIGERRRFAICAGSPTTWNTPPERLKEYGEFMQRTLAEFGGPTASTAKTPRTPRTAGGG